MAEIQTCIRSPNESMGAFNTRLRKACSQSPITSFDAAVVEGQPAVLLISSLIEADEEMVAEEKRLDPNSALKVGATVPEGDPIIVQVVQMAAFADDAARSEELVDRICKRGRGLIDEARYIQGPWFNWVPDRNHLNDDGTPKRSGELPLVMVPSQVTYLVVSYFDDEAAGPEDDKA